MQHLLGNDWDGSLRDLKRVQRDISLHADEQIWLRQVYEEQERKQPGRTTTKHNPDVSHAHADVVHDVPEPQPAHNLERRLALEEMAERSTPVKRRAATAQTIAALVRPSKRRYARGS